MKPLRIAALTLLYGLFSAVSVLSTTCALALCLILDSYAHSQLRRSVEPLRGRGNSDSSQSRNSCTLFPRLCATTDSTNIDAPIDLTPGASVDEELFLVNLLEYYYAIWPTDQDATKVIESLEGGKLAIRTYRNVITRNRLNPSIARLYDEYLQLADANEAFLRNIRAIDQQTVQSVQGGAAEILIDSMVTGIKGNLNKKSDKEILQDIVIDAAFSILKKGVEISRDRQAAIDGEKQQLARAIANTLNSAKATAQTLARNKGWYPDEANFVNAPTDTASTQVSRRPRDYFTVTQLAEVRAAENTLSSNVEAANLYLRAAKLVPAGASYNLFRELAIQDAVRDALEASSIETSGAYSKGPPQSAPLALRLSRTYLFLDPDDNTGFGHAELARALAFAGRYKEAVDAANVVLNTPSSEYRKTADFAYRYAKLMSLTNSLDKAAEWLAYSYTLGWKDIQDVRTTPDFDNFRRARPQRYRELTDVK